MRGSTGRDKVGFLFPASVAREVPDAKEAGSGYIFICQSIVEFTLAVAQRSG